MVHSRLVHSPTIEGIQALCLMIVYLRSSVKSGRADMYNMEWSLSGLIVRLCHLVGLHSDPSHYSLGLAEIRRRRLLFGGVFMFDMILAFMYGRPPALTNRYFDVQPLSDDDMGPQNHYQTWQYKWALECLAPVHALLYADKTPLYSQITQLGTQIEEYRVFTVLETDFERQRPDHEMRVTQSRISRTFKESLLLYLHRPFCLLAAEQHKNDPLSCEHGRSVVVAYRSAGRIISTYREILFLPQEYHINCRWIVTSQVYEAAILLGALIIQCPQLHFTLKAYSQLLLAWSFCQDINATSETSVLCRELVNTILMAKESISSYLTMALASGTMNETQVESMHAEMNAVTRSFPPLPSTQLAHSTEATSSSSVPLQWSPFQEISDRHSFQAARRTFARERAQHTQSMPAEEVHALVPTSTIGLPGHFRPLAYGPEVNIRKSAQYDVATPGWLVELTGDTSKYIHQAYGAQSLPNRDI